MRTQFYRLLPALRGLGLILAASSHGAGPQLEIERTPDGPPRIHVIGDAGRRYQIHVSTDLKDWSPHAELQAETPEAIHMDPDGTVFSHRFYRAMLLSDPEPGGRMLLGL